MRRRWLGPCSGIGQEGQNDERADDGSFYQLKSEGGSADRGDQGPCACSFLWTEKTRGLILTHVDDLMLAWTMCTLSDKFAAEDWETGADHHSPEARATFAAVWKRSPLKRVSHKNNLPPRNKLKNIGLPLSAFPGWLKKAPNLHG